MSLTRLVSIYNDDCVEDELCAVDEGERTNDQYWYYGEEVDAELAARDTRIAEIEAMLEKFEYMTRSLVKSLHESLDCDHKRQSCEDIGCPGAGRRKLIEETRALLSKGKP